MNFIEYYKYNKKKIIKQFNEIENPNLSQLLELFKNANNMLIELSKLNNHHFFDSIHDQFCIQNNTVFNDFIEELKSRLCEGPMLESLEEHSVLWYTTEIGQKVFYKTDHRILDIAWKNYKITYLWLEQFKLDSVNNKRKLDSVNNKRKYECEINTPNLDKCEIKHIINNCKTELETI